MITISERSMGRGRKKELVYTRTFDFQVKNREHDADYVVYIIWFGDKHYIGKAHKYRKRVLEHISAIKCFSWHPEKNYLQENTSYYLIRKYLMENPDIEQIVFEVLEVCTDLEDIERTEFNWVTDIRIYGLYDCSLNYDQVHKTPFDYSDMDMKGMGLFCL